ncbi:nitrobindin family protein [Nocardiopsis alkaliphila]|uniref:FABP family protein n=1 Tax=Nocardiopsis alkaliphila TaxID=225762 RepID=UPI000345A3CA|nr:FABP family protein [Nocardiopsis alkaliphila]
MDAAVHPDLAKLSFLFGRWEGVGVAGYVEEEKFQFGQEVEFAPRAGLPYLAYTSKAWRMNSDGATGELITEESGYWRALSEGDTAEYAKDDEERIVHLEVLIAHNEGYLESYEGNVFANRVEMRSAGIVRTITGLEVQGSHRLYGLFNDGSGNLGYAWDLAARDQGLQSYMSAQLKRVSQIEPNQGK